MCGEIINDGFINFVVFFQLDMLYEAYKRTERKSIPKAHQLMEWLGDNKPKDGKKPGIKR